jgi:hypothetical protein
MCPAIHPEKGPENLKVKAGLKTVCKIVKTGVN